MPTSTTNYGLIKPGTDDPILIEQLNDNADVIDATLKSLSDAIDTAKLGIKFKGEVNYYSNLPNDAEIGDAYTVKYAGSSGTTPDGTEYVWGAVSGVNQWINFSKDSYSKAEVDALLALKQNALNSAQLAAANSGIDSAKVEQIETNKNNISINTNYGVKNRAEPATVVSPSSDITVVQDGEGHYEISGDSGGVQRTIRIYDPPTPLECTEEMFVAPPNTSENATYGCYWTLNGNDSYTTIPAQGLTIPNSAKINRLYIQVQANKIFDFEANLMICPKSIYEADNSFQLYALSNAELTAAIKAIQAQLAGQ